MTSAQVPAPQSHGHALVCTSIVRMSNWTLVYGLFQSASVELALVNILAIESVVYGGLRARHVRLSVVSRKRWRGRKRQPKYEAGAALCLVFRAAKSDCAERIAARSIRVACGSARQAHRGDGQCDGAGIGDVQALDRSRACRCAPARRNSRATGGAGPCPRRRAPERAGGRETSSSSDFGPSKSSPTRR